MLTVYRLAEAEVTQTIKAVTSRSNTVSKTNSFSNGFGFWLLMVFQMLQGEAIT